MLLAARNPRPTCDTPNGMTCQSSPGNLSFGAGIPETSAWSRRHLISRLARYCFRSFMFAFRFSKTFTLTFKHVLSSTSTFCNRSEADPWRITAYRIGKKHLSYNSLQLKVYIRTYLIYQLKYVKIFILFHLFEKKYLYTLDLNIVNWSAIVAMCLLCKNNWIC